MYFATFDVQQQGSTRLHKDGTAAVNLMVWSHRQASTNSDGAEWLIFAKEDAAKLAHALRVLSPASLGDSIADTDPCHGHRIFVDNDLLAKLATWDIKPFRIMQRPGQAVFIPAGCPHQVRTSSCRLTDDY